MRLDARSGGVVLTRCGDERVLHPLWIRERSNAWGAIDPINRQRLYEPLDIDESLSVVWCEVNGDAIVVEFSDGHQFSLPIASIDAPADEPPASEPWIGSNTDVPYIEWGSGDVLGALDAFFRLGFFVLRGTPAEPGALHDIAGRFGRVSATSFGTLFDVRTDPVPVDLAYTPVALSAHTDQPYRHPTPGLQFLHTIVNDAPGGESTVTDGLAAINDLRADDPEAFDVLSTLPVNFRYDIGTDVKSADAPLIELHADGALRQLRFSTRLDFAPAVDPDVLDVYYRGRRWLARELNDPRRQLEFRLGAGDVVVVDNHRVLHGRRSFDPSIGVRHLQGCYIDHDGPATMWRLARRGQLMETI